jgi:hypothetical protein
MLNKYYGGFFPSLTFSLYFQNMIKKIILLAVVHVFFGAIFAQEIMSVDWQENITSNGYINQIYDLETDSHGNVLTLGYFPNEANILGQTLNGNTGEHFLSKQVASGSLLFAINFGAQSCISLGELELSDDDDDMTVAINYRGDFYWNDTVLTTSSNFTAIILKLDSEFNLIWFIESPCVKESYAQLYHTGMVQDEVGNIYTSVSFIDSISIDNVVYSNNGTAYGMVLSKFDSFGNHIWTHQYQSETGSTLTKIVLAYHPNINGVPELIISGHHPSSTLFIDSVPIILDSQSGAFISKVDVNGNILESIRVRNIDHIVDFGFAEDRIFFAGIFHDTVSWEEGSTISGSASAFIGELSHSSDLVNFIDLMSTSSINLKGFNISDEYGFVIHGNYNGTLSFQSTVVSQVSSPSKGAFIASFDAGFSLNQAKYVPAFYFNFKELRFKDSLVYGAGIFEDDLEFSNSSNHSWNDDICVFRINDFNQLAIFENLSNDNEIGLLTNVSLFPNPTQDKIYFLGLDESKIYHVNIYNSMGKLIVRTSTNTNSIVISSLSVGSYILKFDEIQYKVLRFIKK